MTKKRLQSLLLILIIILAAVLRLNRYAYFPIMGEAQDETAWTMLGASLIQEGKPTSWSEFDAYKKHATIIDRSIEIPHTVVSPVFDHPPLFSIIPGLAQSIKGSWRGPFSAKVIRLPIICVGLVNVYLLFLLSKKLFSHHLLSLLPVLIYATAPLFVFSHRLVVAENLLTTWILLTLLVLYSNKIKKRFILLVFLSAAAMLTKMSGIIIPLSLITYGIVHKQNVWKAGLVGMVVGIAIFAVYGAFYDWQLFLQVSLTQTSRGLGFATLYNRLFLHPALVHRIYSDGWMIVGLVSMLYLIFANKKQFFPIIVIFLANTLFIHFFVAEQTFYGWYEYPMFPLLCIAISYVLRFAIRKKIYSIIGVFWLLLLPLHRYALINTNIYYQLSPMLLRLVMIAGFVPWGLHLIKVPSKVVKYSAILLACLILLSNITAVLTFTQETYWGTDEHLYFRGSIYP